MKNILKLFAPVLAMKNLYYYKSDEAEAIKKAYSSWIGKEAHIGKGKKETLKAINIKPKRQYKKTRQPVSYFRVEFEFYSSKKFSAHEFFFHNSLLPDTSKPEPASSISHDLHSQLNTESD